MSKLRKNWPIWFIWAFGFSIGLNAALITHVDGCQVFTFKRFLFHICGWYFFGAIIGHIGAKYKPVMRLWRLRRYRRWRAAQRIQAHPGPYRSCGECGKEHIHKR